MFSFPLPPTLIPVVVLTLTVQKDFVKGMGVGKGIIPARTAKPVSTI